MMINELTRTGCRTVCLGRRLLFLAILASFSNISVVFSQSGSQVTPQGRIENMRFDVGNGATIVVTYDLVADDPRATFVTAFEISRDGGRTFGAVAEGVSGDAGPNVRAGVGKQATWAAGAEAARLISPQFRVRVRLVSATAGTNVRPVTPASAARSIAGLNISSVPPAAKVFVDDVERGETPVTISDLAPGKHRVRLVKDGYLENSTELDLKVGRTQSLDKKLTATPVATPSATQPSAGGGGHKGLAIGIPVAAAGAVGIALVASKGGSNSTPATAGCVFTISPTSVTVPAVGSSTAVAVTASPSGCSPNGWTAFPTTTYVGISPTSGNGSGTVTVLVPVNVTGSTRAGTGATIAGVAFGVNQSTVACAYTFRATDGDPTAPNPTWSVGGGAGAVARHVGVTTTDPLCPWTASTNVSWIHLIQTSGSGSTASGPAQGVALTFDQNTAGAARTGVVTFTGYTTVTTFNVTQRFP